MSNKNSAKESLQSLATEQLKNLQELNQPVVRLSGPLTTGPIGYEENARRFVEAENILSSKGYQVFSFAEAEDEIYGRGYEHDDVMQYFHYPLLDSGYFAAVFFLPNWETSKGSSLEREYVKKHTNTEIKEFPEEWFPEPSI